MICIIQVLLIVFCIARIEGHVTTLHDEQQNMYGGYDNTIPAAPVQGQGSSCALDLSNQLLGGVKAACTQGPLNWTHCCPVLAAWLMAARAKVALHPPLQQDPGMPLLPDDSLVCIASLKAALAARGIIFSSPALAPSANGSSCDVVTCFCGIHLSDITSQSCPLPFSFHGEAANSTSNSSSLSSQPTFPHLVQHTRITALSSSHKINSSGLLHDPTIKASKDVPLQASGNETSITLPSSSTPPLASLHSGMSDLLQQLAGNCTDHSYRGCTRCLKALSKEMKSDVAKEIIGKSKEKAMECEMIGLMWLLELNKTLYIPTVSAVVRALRFNNISSTYKCSPDTDNMPLALDYSELMSTSNSYEFLVNPPLITSLVVYLILVTSYSFKLF